MKKYGKFTNKELILATNSAYKAQNEYRNNIITKGQEIIKLAREKDMQIIVLCGRPYHI